MKSKVFESYCRIVYDRFHQGDEVMTREEEIIFILSEQNKVSVSELAERLKVSSVTIRKSLDKLERRGLLQRQHGYAELNNMTEMSNRLALNFKIKKKIAERAAEDIKDGEAVMIESGSTCALLAAELAFNRKDITIITNSNFLADYVRKAETVKIILLGGEYQKDSQVNVGPLIQTIISKFHVNKLFVGADGYDLRRGFTGTNLARADAARSMAMGANQVVVMTDSSKFTKSGLYSTFSIDEVSQLYTDNSISADMLEHFRELDVEVVEID